MQFIKKFLLVLPIAVLLSCYSEGEEANGDVIAFYNVQNLFDTENDPHTRDDEFTPSGSAKWTVERYQKKLHLLAGCISELGDQDGPEILGLSEVENQKVLEDLIDQKELKGKYKIVHYDSPDQRGIDVALLYKNSKYKLLNSHSFRLSKYKDIVLETRDILYCRLVRDKDTLMFLVNHWNSRRGGQDKTKKKRLALAHFVKHLSDSLQQKHPDDLLLIMGDFNDTPTDPSMVAILKAQQYADQVKEGGLFNPFFRYVMSHGEIASHRYDREWMMYDQIIVNEDALHNKGWHYLDNSANVYHPLEMHYQSSAEKGPWKTYGGKEYYGGYSDHFPVYIRITK